MTVTYGFYNSVSSDRLYDAVQISRIFDGIINDGVYATIPSQLLTASNLGMQIKIQSGRAWFNRTWTYNDGNLLFTLAAAHATYNRIDLVYLEVDHNTRINKIDVYTGTPASNPIRPIFLPETGVYRYPLAEILVQKTVTTINQQDITNLIGVETPFVTGLLSVVSTADLVAQWEAEWDNWFNYIMDELSEEAAGNLQNQITEMRGDNNPAVISLLTLKSHDHTGGNGNPVLSGGLASNAVTAGKIASGGVSATSQLADNIVDDTKVGNRVPQLRRRQGGSSSDWSSPTTVNNNYTPTTVRKQVGVRRITIIEGFAAQGSVVIFPEAFSNKPMVSSLTIMSDILGSDFKHVYAINISTSQMTIYISRNGSLGSLTVDIGWEVTGPE